MIQQQIELEPGSRIMEVYSRLLAEQGKRALKARRDPMRELVSTMLSHRTTHANEEAAYERMWQRYTGVRGNVGTPVGPKHPLYMPKSPR